MDWTAPRLFLVGLCAALLVGTAIATAYYVEKAEGPALELGLGTATPRNGTEDPIAPAPPDEKPEPAASTGTDPGPEVAGSEEPAPAPAPGAPSLVPEAAPPAAAVQGGVETPLGPAGPVDEAASLIPEPPAIPPPPPGDTGSTTDAAEVPPAVAPPVTDLAPNATVALEEVKTNGTTALTNATSTVTNTTSPLTNATSPLTNTTLPPPAVTSVPQDPMLRNTAPVTVETPSAPTNSTTNTTLPSLPGLALPGL